MQEELSSLKLGS